MAAVAARPTPEVAVGTPEAGVGEVPAAEVAAEGPWAGGNSPDVVQADA